MANVIGEPRVVDAGRGAAWWGMGWRLFASGFWSWIGIMIIYLVLSVLIGLIPHVGDVGHSLLVPVFMGGLMQGCFALRQGQPLRVAHFFEGFQGAHFVALLVIGLINLAILFGLIVVGGLVAGGLSLASLATLGAGGDPFAMIGSMFATIGLAGLLVFLVLLTIVVVMGMLNWFAPALVMLQGATAFEAMTTSFRACLRNWVPFLVYGLIALGAAIAAALLFGALVAVFGVGFWMSGGGFGGGWGTMVGLFVLLLALIAIATLFIGPIVIGSTYAGYEDTLGVDDVTLPKPASHQR